jgi:hypothetical protein
MPSVELFFTKDFAQAAAEIVARGGRVTQKFTDALFEASLPEGADPSALQFAALTPDFALDERTDLMARAWRKVAQDRLRPPAAADGSGEERQHPRTAYNDPILAAQFKKKAEFTTGTPTSLYMTGKIAVGLVVVSGPTADLVFSNDELTTVVSEVVKGLQFLSTAEPGANITFVYDYHALTVSAAAVPACSSYETCESVWRDPALQQLQFSTGLDGCVEFADDLKQNENSNWSYVAFITKYPQHWFAYASGVRLCIAYDKGGWRPDQIHQVFAHESCHIFGAADEYSPCTCDPTGYYNVPNDNCESCTTAPVDCLMAGSENLAVCQWTRGQIGWSYWEPTQLKAAAIYATSDWPVSSSAKVVYRIDENGALFQLGTGPWTQIQPPPGNQSKFCALAALNLRGVVVGLEDGTVWDYFRGVYSPYPAVPGGVSVLRVAPPPYIGLWALNKAGTLFYFKSGVGIDSYSWVPIAGTWRAFSSRSYFENWAVDALGNVQTCTDDHTNWTPRPGPAGVTFSDISAWSDGTVLAIADTGDIYRYVGGATGWNQIAGKLSKIAVGGSSNIWGFLSPAGAQVGDLFHRRVLTG